MLAIEAIVAWLVIVAASAFVVSLLARRWGHDPFGWILLSAVLGPIVLVGLLGARMGELERPSRRRAQVSGREGAPKFRILAAVDGSPYGSLIARRIVNQHPGARVTLLAVLPKESEPGGDERSRMDHDARVAAITSAPLAILEAAGCDATVTVAYGVAGEEIVRCAEEESPDLLIVGRRGAGLTKLLLGSVSDYVVRSTERPVMIVGAE